MQTNVLKPSKKVYYSAAKLLKKSEIVAFHTETVYGLGANALDEGAVKKIFQAKGRPADNPLIVHISSIEQLNSLIKEGPIEALTLIKKFWPGPLTLIFKKNIVVPTIVTAGLDTVAIRMPKSKIALSLIKSANVPIAAPSANSSGKPSPTKAEHVFEDLNGKIQLIIDGGKCDVGLESTVLDLTKKPFTILRPGAVTKEQLEKVLGKENVVLFSKKEISLEEKVSSPGMKYKHYAPKASVLLFSKQNEIDKIVLDNKEKKIAVIGINKFECSFMIFHKSVEDYSKNIFSDFRKLDNLGFDIILVEKVEEKGLGNALMNRMKKAALN